MVHVLANHCPLLGKRVTLGDVQPHADGRPLRLRVDLDVGHQRVHQCESAAATDGARPRSFPRPGVGHDQEQPISISRAPHGHLPVGVLDRVCRGFMNGQDDGVSHFTRRSHAVEPGGELVSQAAQSGEIRRKSRLEWLHVECFTRTA